MNIAIFKPNQTPQYLISVDPTPYLLDPQAPKGTERPKDDTIVLHPDISTLQNVPLKFWKKVGNAIQEMTQAEKDAIIAAELQTRKDAVVDPSNASLKDILTALIKVINVRLSAGQKITKEEFITAIKAEIV